MRRLAVQPLDRILLCASRTQVSHLILLSTGVSLLMGVAAFAAGAVTGNYRWVDEFFRLPGAVLLVSLAFCELRYCAMVRRDFSQAQQMFRAWSLIAFGAACNVIAVIFVQ